MMKEIVLNLCFLIPFGLSAQNVSMNDMSFWKSSGKNNWATAGSVFADMNTKESMTPTAGTGVLVNLPTGENKANLESVLEHGDAEISFDFMMAAHSNSGFYLQGRYEVQLLDSWGVINPNTGDCGGIYKRRRYIKDANGKDQEYLWEGHAPRINTCLAPGLWQHMDILFQAPKFDATGKKTQNAKVISIRMNGVLIQENVELTGPTGGPISETEVAKGPIMIQGDHGPVAFRNMVIKNLAGKPVAVKDISYKTFYGTFREPKDFLTKKENGSGKLDKFTWEVVTQPNDFAVIYSSKLVVPEAGLHKLTFQMAGKNYIKINGNEVLDDQWTQTRDKRTVEVNLPAGEVPMEITVYKIDGWLQSVMGVWVAGPGFRAVPLHTLGSIMAGVAQDPILLDAKQTTILRSFSDLMKDGKRLKRVTHAVNVGSPEKLHYTYDLDNGAIAQIWKGDFLETSPMWDDRGDGSSRPRGVVLPFDSSLPFEKIENLPEINYKILGYDLDENDLPTFKYQIWGDEINDKITISESKYLTRRITSNRKSQFPIMYKLAVGKSIAKVNSNTYLVDEKYYIKVEGAQLQDMNGQTHLWQSLEKELIYSIIW